MLNSSKLAPTPKNGLQKEKSADSTISAPEFSPGQITSTPIRKNNLFSTPIKPHVLSHRRYSLSDIATPPRISRRDPIRSNLSVNSTGPLLTSANFSVNYGTYEETKSPGLASRIVQYNEETERKKEKMRPPTHQAKYGSPGLFPVVHLFKTDPPVLEPKSRRVTVKIPSSVRMRHSQEYNRKLLEGIIKPNTSTNISRSYSLSSGESNNSTRSVLDALKEISRKRIHASEEYDEDSGKRQKTDLINGADSNKRLLEDSPSAENATSPIKQVPKKLCMYDEYAASCSSTDYFFEKSGGSKRKSVSTSTLPETPEKITKQVKLINAETQTLTNETLKSTEDKPESDSKDASEKSEMPEKTQKSPETALKIFDDAPLERIRKNRLAALMGSLTGKEPVFVPKPTLSSVLNGEIPMLALSTEERKTPEKPLVSILTTSKGSAQKTEKHVTFNISESISFGSASSTDSIVDVNPKESTKTTLETPAPPSSPINLEPGDKSTNFGAPPVSVELSTNNSTIQFTKPTKELEVSAEAIVPITESHSPKLITNISMESEAPKTQSTPPMFQFPKSSVNPPQFNFGTSKTSPPKVGGFKFDSNIVPVAVTPKPTSTAVTAALSFSFGTPLPTSNTPTGFSLGKNVAETGINDFSFGKLTSTTTATTVSNPDVLSFKNTSNKLAVNSSSDSSKPSTTTVTTMLGFGTSTINSVSTAPITSSSVAPTFKFNSESNTNLPSFASTSTSVTSSNFNPSTFSFGKSPPAPSSSTGSFNFSLAVTTSGGFKLPSSTGFSSSFPNTTSASTNNFPMPAAPPNAFGGFGTSVTPTVSTSVAFGNPTSTNSFATTMTSSGGLNFGNKSTPIFAAVPTTTSTSFENAENSPFAVPFTTQANFGAPTTTSFSTTSINSSNIFGGSTVTTAGNSGGFGTHNIFTASNANSTSFATTTASKTPFGNTISTTTTAGSSFNAPVFSFGTKATGNIFPSTTTTSSNIFGGTTQSFTSPSTFGAPNFEQPSSFGNANFVTTQSRGFGVTNTPTFGVSNQGGFGTPKTPMFGTNTTTPGFGAPQNATNTAFGSSNPTTPAFGPSGTPVAFGGGSNASAFSKPSSFGAPQGNFGTATAGFNSNQTATTTQAAIFNFGTPSAKPGIFSFGGTPSGDNAKPAFNFNAGSSATAFGTNSSAFGATGGNASNTFVGSGNSGSSFGSTGSSATSAFGSTGGDPSNTFGNTGGNISNSFGATGGNATNSFGAAGVTNSNATFGASANNTSAFASAGVNNNTFGANNSPFPGVLPFGTPPPGGAMFNIGSGAPTNNRPRTQLKAKRRT